MLSALIPWELSYPAMLLAEQPVDQRFPQPGPLVTYSPITRGADYIFTQHSVALRTGVGVLGRQ